MKIYYKVVNRDLKSCCENHNFPEHFRVQYKIGEWTYPVISNTRLFLFRFLSDAEHFKNGDYNWLIYSCHAKNVAKVNKLSYISDIEYFWKLKKKHRKLYNYILAPNGTYSCSAIKLIEKINENLDIS